MGESPIQLSGEGDNKLNYKRRSPIIDSFRAGLLRPILLDSTKLGRQIMKTKLLVLGMVVGTGLLIRAAFSIELECTSAGTS